MWKENSKNVGQRERPTVNGHNVSRRPSIFDALHAIGGAKHRRKITSTEKTQRRNMMLAAMIFCPRATIFCHQLFVIAVLLLVSQSEHGAQISILFIRRGKLSTHVL